MSLSGTKYVTPAQFMSLFERKPLIYKEQRCPCMYVCMFVFIKTHTYIHNFTPHLAIVPSW